MDVRKLLEEVKTGEMDLERAEALLKDLPYEDLGYAKLDHHRALRSGFGETVFCQSKPDEYLVQIFKKFYERDGEVLGTRASEEQYRLVKALVPEVSYDPVSRILKVEKPGKEHRPDRSMHRGHGGHPGGGGGGPDCGVFRLRGGPDLRRGRGGDSPAFIPAGADHEGQLHRGGGGHGRGAGNGDRRSGGRAGDRGAHFGGVRGQLPRPFGSADDVKFLCQRNFCGKY